MTTWITVCDTCKRDGWEPGAAGITDGERLAVLVEVSVAEGPTATAMAEIRTRRHACLMGCTRACNVAIQATGKVAYTLGRFEPGAEAAEAIVAYARLHAASENGVVAYRSWPAAIKGHFITRHPPLPA